MVTEKDDVRYMSQTEQGQYLTLKEAAALTEYTPDYIGQLIRAGKIEGVQVYTNVSWVTTEKAIRTYMDAKGKGDVRAPELSSPYLNPHTYLRLALYIVIGCLVCLLAVLAYISIVSIDRAVTESSLEEFESRTQQY